MSKVNMEEQNLLNQQEQKKDSLTKVSIVLVVLTLLGAIGFTIYYYSSLDNKDDQDLSVIIDQNIELDAYYNQRFLKKDIAKQIKIQIIRDSNNEVTVKISDANNPGFELPEDSEYFPNNKNSKDTKSNIYSYNTYLNKKTGAIKITRRNIVDGSDGDIIFDTTNHLLLVSKQYTQFGTDLNSNYLYGLGERRMELRYKGSGNYTTWPKDQFARLENGTPSNQLYGYHPMWLSKDTSGQFHVGFLKSTSALLTQIDEGQRMIFHVVGGNIVLKFFIGTNDPEKVIQSYHRYINGFAIHPFWSQGYHQCRWGYKSSLELLAVVQQMDANDHPVDSLWNDLDYMTNYQDFTLHQDFKPTEMAKLVDRTVDGGVHWIPLIDIGIAINTVASKKGDDMNVFLKSAVYPGKNLEGCVWPGAVVFPDFNHPNATKYWMDVTNMMRDDLKTEPSGYWIDMNELASFIHGERDVEKDEPCPGANPPFPLTTKPEVNDMLYLPVSVAGENLLGAKTATLKTLHYGGQDALLIKNNQELSEQYFHSINNLAEQIATDQVLKKFTNKKLQFSLTRASIYGSGRYTTHWTGDNYAGWEFLRLGVSELLPFQFYGIPMVGNDLCGFAGNTNAELCAKWLALGAWEPFSRNHNDNESISQEPYSFQEPYVLTASKAAFKNRYSLLKWMYTQFVNAFETDKQFGTGTIIQPIWWLETADTKAFDYEDKLFLFGKTFLIAPVLTQGDAATETTKVTTYFPLTQKWVDCEDFKTEYEGGKEIEFTRKFNQQALSFQKQGTIVFRQTPRNRARLLDDIFDLDVYVDSQFTATGSILTLTDYEENNVADKCLMQGTNCVAVFTITLSEDMKTITVKVDKRNDQTIFEGFNIRNIRITRDGKIVTKIWNQKIDKAEEFKVAV